MRDTSHDINSYSWRARLHWSPLVSFLGFVPLEKGVHKKKHLAAHLHPLPADILRSVCPGSLRTELDMSGTPLPDNLSKYFSLQGRLRYFFSAFILCYLIANVTEEYAVSFQTAHSTLEGICWRALIWASTKACSRCKDQNQPSPDQWPWNFNSLQRTWKVRW